MAPMSLPARLSPSALDRYRSCPRRFLWQDVERRPFERVPSPELALGNAVHRTLELLFRLRPEERGRAAAHRLLRSVWPEFRTRETFSSVEHEAACGREALAMLARYVERFDVRVQPVKVEQWLELRMQSADGRRVVISTRIDRIDPGAGGTLRLVDYKTGKRRIDDGRELAGDTAALVHLVAATQASGGRQIARLSHVYLHSGEEIFWEPEEEDVGAARDRLASLIRTIQEDDRFEPAPGPLCSWCPFALQCDATPPAELEAFVPVVNLPF